MKALFKWRKTAFGKSLDIEMPDGCDVIILGVMKQKMDVLHILLPHQVYEHDLKRLAKEHGAEQFLVIPYNSKNVVPITASR